MMQRCYNEKNSDYKDYGGRGIKVYTLWHIPAEFIKYLLKHLGRRPSRKHSLDRIDVDGNYEPDNIRWATNAMQVLNRRKASTWRKPIYDSYTIVVRRNKNKRHSMKFTDWKALV